MIFVTGYLQTFVVTGSAPFPIDMLRYDRCWPVNEQEALAIQRSNAAPHEPGLLSVTLRRYTDVRRSMPAEDRWSSFGWRITEVES